MAHRLRPDPQAPARGPTLGRGKRRRTGRTPPAGPSATTLGAMAHRLRPDPQEPERGTTLGREAPMASSPDAARARIEAYHWPPQRGGVEVLRASRGYTLYSLRT